MALGPIHTNHVHEKCRIFTDKVHLLNIELINSNRSIAQRSQATKIQMASIYNHCK